jgi:iron complex outermembrane receptor protein
MKYFSLAVLFVMLFAGVVSAGDDLSEKELEEISVTATRTERSEKDIPAGVDIVSKQDIENTKMFNLQEALSGISGVQSETRNGGYDARLIIRGAGLKAQYGVREIMILLDGVPITDPDGMSRLDFVDSQLVERIDIVKGPNSTLYGANAAGGVINIITKNPFEERKSVTVGYGSENTQMYNLNLGTSIGNTYFSLSGSRRSTDSWRVWNEFSTNQGTLKIGHLFADNSTVEATINYSEADIQLPGTLTRQQFEQDIRQLTGEPWRNSGRYSKVFFSNVKFEKEIGNFTLKPVVYFETWSHFHPVTGIINDGGSNVYGADFQADMKHRIAGMQGTLTAGLAGQVDDGDGKKYTYRDCSDSSGNYVPCINGNFKNSINFTTSDAKGALAEVDDDMTTKWGVFVQESLRPSTKWIIDAGIRYDQVTFDIDNLTYHDYDYSKQKYVIPDASEASVRLDKNFDAISPRIGVVYILNDIINLYGNISTGFQTPQSSEMSKNPYLTPMKVYNYETGMKARFAGGHSIDLSAFYMNVKDEIVQTMVDSDSTYSNAGKSVKKGIELSVKFQILKGLFAGGTYTYSDFKFREFTEWIRGVPNPRNGKRFPYIPENQDSLFVSYKHPSGLKFMVETSTWGEYYVDNANTEKYGGYEFLTNALIGYEKKNFDVTLYANNVFDKRYAMEVTKDTSGSTKYRPGAPFSLMAKVTYRF